MASSQPHSDDKSGLRLLIRAALLRAASAALTWLGVLGLLLALLTLAKGDPIALLPNAEAVRPALAEAWGLNASWHAQLFRWVSGALSGELGTSLSVRPGASVSSLVGPAALRSATLLIGSVGWSGLLSALIGTLHARGWTAPRAAVVAFSALPGFLAVHLAVYGSNELAFAGINAGLWPRPSWFALPDVDSAARTALAIVALGSFSGVLAEASTEASAQLKAALGLAHVDAARVRGEALWQHLVRALAPPMAANLATRVARLLGELVIIEQVLLIPGLGSLLWRSCLLRDYDVALAVALCSGAAVIVTRLVAELTALWSDPRFREPARW